MTHWQALAPRRFVPLYGYDLRPHGPHPCAACQECHESELLPISSTSGVRWACQNVKPSPYGGLTWARAGLGLCPMDV